MLNHRDTETQREAEIDCGLPSDLYRGAKITREQFFDLLIIAISGNDPDGTGEPPWNVKVTADRAGLIYDDEWIDDFFRNMENPQNSVVFSDSKPGSSSDDPCCYPESAAVEAAPFLIEKYFGFLDFDRFPYNAIGQGLSVPASNRIVSLEHNSASYREAINALDVAEEKIRGFNEPTDYEKEQIVGELKAAKVLFKSTKIRVGTVTAIVLAPLYTVYHDVAAASLKPFVLAAIEAIKALVGL